VILVLGLALIYAVLFCVALATVSNVAVKWTRAMVNPYSPKDFENKDPLGKTVEIPEPPEQGWPRRNFP
jgi:hypothetical protein